MYFSRSARLSMASPATLAVQLTRLETKSLSSYVKVEKLKLAKGKTSFKVSEVADMGRV